MHRRLAVIVTCVLLVAGSLAVTTATSAAPPGGIPPAERQALSKGMQVAAKSPGNPVGANPFLALTADPSEVDYAAWKRWLDAKGEQRAAQRPAPPAAVSSPIVVDEDEPAGTSGSNDTRQTAEATTGFGTAPGSNPRARLLGSLAPSPIQPVAIPRSTEDDGSIPLARNTGIGTGIGGRAITTTGRVGDGPHGSAGSGSGDFDFYKVRATAGLTLTADIDTPSGSLDSVLELYDSAGNFIAFNDDSDGLDSLLRFPITTTGDYYVMVGGFPSFPIDPFDSSSGIGAGSEGPYNVGIRVVQEDVDFYGVSLRKGDVLGASVSGSATSLAIYGPGGTELHGSTFDATFIYPPASPLPGGGNAVTEHVAEGTGVHYIAVASGVGSYDVTAELYRPPLETETPIQTLFLDFDGARINTGIWGGPGVRTLSPLQSFLGRWGLTNANLDALINRIIVTVRENLRNDMVARGNNSSFAIRILNSRDHADPFGQPNVSRVIVGGTIAQSGIDTIGIAQSIDPGNFAQEESALVLLDLVSEPAGQEYSFNTWLRASSSRIAFVGRALGNIVSHEAGHFFGDWHVDQFNSRPNLMDQGGNFPVLYGVGPDGIGGTADDVDVDFGDDTFNPNEGFTGLEDTLTRISQALTS